ncbi:MAG: divergent polysaccharide deacetylase family protein [Alphaproteobacteria bacterium]
MLDYIKEKIFLILIWVLTIVILVSLAYVFAEVKTKPEFLNKIDSILYSKENLSPRYMIIMPDTVQPRQYTQQIKKPVVVKNYDQKVRITDANKLAVEIPKIENLKSSGNYIPLDVIEINAENAKEIENSPRKWITYSKKIDIPQKFFKVAVIINKMGINEKYSEKIIENINENISLAFSPYARNLVDNVKNARRHGNETYLDLILPSKDYLLQDTGPLAIKLDESPEQNLKVLDDIEAQNALVGGVVLLGDANYEDRKEIKGILQEIQKKGLLFVDATQGELLGTLKINHLPRQKADIIIDDAMPKEVLVKIFEEAEEIAQEKGQVVISITPRPVNIINLSEWTQTFSKPLSYEEIKEGKKVKKPFVLVPVSMLVVE